MQQEKLKTTIMFHENHIYFFLHTQTVNDINHIVKTFTSGLDQRHCSTTLLSIIPLAGATASAVTKIFGESNGLYLLVGGTIDKTLLVRIK